jgi:hypothetical protein
MFNYLKKGGVYFIEDVWPISEMSSKELDHPWVKQHALDFDMLNEQYFLKVLANKNVQRYDLRYQTGQPDSYIIKVTK